jgi:hypothetical protein
MFICSNYNPQIKKSILGKRCNREIKFNLSSYKLWKTHCKKYEISILAKSFVIENKSKKYVDKIVIIENI